MRTLMLLLIFISSFFCLSDQSFGAEALKNKSIAVVKPGSGIGNIGLDDSLEDVIKKMGLKPTDGNTITSGIQTEYWVHYKEMGITFIFSDEQKLVRIAVTNPGIIVQNGGIRVNSSVKEIVQLYGFIEPTPLDNDFEQWSYKALGISFTVNKNTRKIETIIVEKTKHQ